ncbi:hypothetical protein SK128_005902 [Halocaridina rubra]|uniref:Peptidase S1 domain-containing protein n=1 Tax=Halocaridina rubra TaxID=373956 RepID=A0AAN8WRZ4_HALRR
MLKYINYQWTVTQELKFVFSFSVLLQNNDIIIELLQIIAGKHDLTKADGTEQTRNIQEIIIHEDYNSSAPPYDIALLKLSNPLMLNTYAQSVPLPFQGQMTHGNCIASGWGSLIEGGLLSSTLHKVILPIVSEEVCKTMYSGNPSLEIDNTMICAGVMEGGKDTCQGDSGGPLVCIENGIQYLGGIVSGGIGCARPGFLGVYARVSFFVDWIENYLDSDALGWLKVSKRELPHQISLEMKGHFITSSLCSGSILSENWVVTAAQCVNGHNKRNLQVVAGENDLTDDEETEQVKDIQKITSNEN